MVLHFDVAVDDLRSLESDDLLQQLFEGDGLLAKLHAFGEAQQSMRDVAATLHRFMNSGNQVQSLLFVWKIVRERRHVL